MASSARSTTSGAADFAAAPLTVTGLSRGIRRLRRTAYFNFGLVVVARPAKWINVAVRRGGPAFFLAVFDVWVWLACGGLMLLTSLLLYCNSRCNPRELEDLYLFWRQSAPLFAARTSRRSGLKGGSTDHFFATAKEALFQQFNGSTRLHCAKRPGTAGLLYEGAHLAWSWLTLKAVMEAPMADFFVKKTDCEVIVLGDLTNDKSYGLAFAPELQPVGSLQSRAAAPPGGRRECWTSIDALLWLARQPLRHQAGGLHRAARSREVGDILARMFPWQHSADVERASGGTDWIFSFAGVGLSLIAFLVVLDHSPRLREDSVKLRRSTRSRPSEGGRPASL
uniref:PBPe domain-containing protein n=1 Tax=Macrostomum lignano TaxID=282301 RepID=A0A1I8FSJ4_9PLAT